MRVALDATPLAGVRTGIGHYTETDVQQSARAFTGWTLIGGGQLRSRTDSVFVPRLHDAGSKTFMGKTGNFIGDDIVEMLVQLRATAILRPGP